MGVTMRTFIFSALFLFASIGYSQSVCLDLFSKKANTGAVQGVDAEYSDSLALEIFNNVIRSNRYTDQEVALVESQLEKSGILGSPISISRANAEFRKLVLPIMRFEPNHREALISMMEADLRQRSALLEKRIGDLRTEYDVVIVGAGIHGTIALQSLLRQKPNLKILVIEESDTAAATFRYPNNTFRINSSNRASGEDALPLPGRGNINELPQLPIQVSDLTAVKYPTAGDLGSAVVAGLYAASISSKVDVLFTSNVTKIAENAFTQARPAKFDISGKFKTNSPFTVSTRSLILASGLGTPRVPDSVLESITPEMLRTRNALTSPPKVMTFESIMRILGQSSNPRELLSGKKVAVVGTGDSANVLIEFFLGYAAEAGYGVSNAQIAPPAKILWVGQSRETCEDFIADARSRYAQIGTGFRSSDPNGDPLIDATPNKLVSLKQRDRDGRLVLSLEDSSAKLDADYVILATGFEGQLYKLFDRQYDVSGISIGERPYNDKDLINNFFSTVTGRTETTGNRNTDIAKEAFTYIGGKETEGSGIYVLGPAAGPLAKESELFGIIQNTVSIFNNSLRTEAAAELIASEVRASADANTAVGLHVAKGNSAIGITGIQQTKSYGNATSAYLESVLLNALKPVQFDKSGSLEITFISDPQTKNLTVVSNYNIQEVVKLLAVSRDFFPTVSGLVSLSGKYNVWKLRIDISDGKADLTPRSYEFNFDVKEGVEGSVSVENAQFPLMPIVLDFPR